MNIDPLSFIVWMTVGTVAGWLAIRLPRGHRRARLGSMIIGILGACVGGFLLTQFGVVSVSLVGDLTAATVGALFLLLVGELLIGA